MADQPTAKPSTAYRGFDKRGFPRTGRTARTPCELAESLYKAGWRQLTIEEAEAVVGAIVHDETGRRTWWCEASG